MFEKLIGGGRLLGTQEYMKKTMNGIRCPQTLIETPGLLFLVHIL